MSVSLLPPSLLAPNQPGVCVEEADWNNLLSFMWDTAGYAVAFSQGVQNAIPQFQALTCTAAGGMVIQLGGTAPSPQFAMIGAVICGSESVQQFTVPNNSSGQTRIDVVAVQFTQVQGSTVSRPIQGGGSASIPYNYAGIAYQYVEGTPGSGQPSVPAGWVAFATITVASGAGSITNGNISVLFPLMNPAGPTGPQGPAGHGTTTLTSNVTIPNLGASVTMAVADATAFQPGVNGLVSDGTNAMYFLVTGVASLNVTVVNLGAPDGFSNTGTINHSSSLVGFGSPQPFTFTTQPINGWTDGAALSWTVNSVDEWNLKMFGVVFGPNNAPGAFIFQVENIVGNTLYGNVVSIIAGNGSATINRGAYVFPIAPPVVLYMDNTDVTNLGMLEICGRISDPGNGNTFNVTFPNGITFQSTSTWRFKGLTPFPTGAHGFTPQITAKTTTGFTVYIPTDTTGHGDIEWCVVGQLYIV